MDTTLKKDKYGLVQTGAGTAVNPNFATPQALEQARVYAGNVSPVVNADAIGSTKPLVLPDASPMTRLEGLGGMISGYVEGGKAKALQDEMETAANTADSEKGGVLTEYKNKILEKMGVQSSKSDVQKEFKVPELVQKYDAITNELDALERAHTNALRALETSGKDPNAMAAATRDINKDFNFRKADLAVLQLASGKQLDSARTLADEKIKAQLEPIDTYLGALEKYIDFNQEDWSQAKKNKYDLKKDEVIAERNRQEADYKRLSDVKIDLMGSAAEQEAPEPVLRAINNAKTPEEAIAAAGKYGGDIMEKMIKEQELALKRQQLAESVAKTEQALKTLPAGTQTRVQTVANQFDNEPIVKEYNTIATTLDAVNAAGTTPTDDIQRVYAFAKVMDPNSVVRESEYDTVQKYSQAVLEFAGLKGKRIFTNTGFLTDEARGFLATTLQNRFKSTQKAYDNVYSEYGRRINKITGGEDGTEYVTDYRKAFAPGQTGGGDVQVVNGVRYVQAEDGLYYPE